MTIIYRLEKGSPLTLKEIDNNFRELETRLLKIETHITEVESLKKVSLSEGQLIFEGTFGTLLGKCSLPILLFQPRGFWKKNQSYALYDLVVSQSNVLCCVKNHTSQSLDEDQDAWKLLIDGLSLFKQTYDPSHSAASERENFSSGKKQKNLKNLKGFVDVSQVSSFPNLPLYDIYNLPKPELGKMGILVHQGQSDLILATPTSWIRIHDQQEVFAEPEEDHPDDDLKKEKEEEEEEIEKEQEDENDQETEHRQNEPSDNFEEETRSGTAHSDGDD